MKSNRRNFIKSTAAGAATIPVVVATLASTQALAKKPDGLVSEDDPTAKALGYKHDATKVNRKDKMGVKAELQNCSNCSLYKPVGKDDGVSGVGKCTMITKGNVKGAGSCNSWILNPKKKPK